MFASNHRRLDNSQSLGASRQAFARALRITSYSLPGGVGGWEALSGVVLGSKGDVYSATAYGGDLSCGPSYLPGCGVVFRIGALTHSSLCRLALEIAREVGSPQHRSFRPQLPLLLRQLS